MKKQSYSGGQFFRKPSDLLTNKLRQSSLGEHDNGGRTLPDAETAKRVTFVLPEGKCNYLEKSEKLSFQGSRDGHCERFLPLL